MERLAEAIDPKTATTAAMFSCAYHGHYSLVEELCKMGADVNFTNTFGRTPIMYAAARNDVEYIRILLNYGADPKLRDRDDKTAYMIAKEKENGAAMEILEHLT